MNQCDGCNAGYPVINGIHKVPYPAGDMVCQANKYSKDKPYFAKFLPRGGKIKEGDWFFDSGGTLYPTPAPKELLDSLIDQQGLHKAKLFILNKCYEVIGKVSSEVTWVKEGDEFSENEIEKVYHDKYECLCEDKSHKVYRTPEQQNCNHMVDDHRGGDFCTRQVPAISFIKIKGPCGHFH